MRQLTLFPAYRVLKNCSKCGQDFDDYSSYGRGRICNICKGPAHVRPTYNKWKDVLGKPFSKRELQIAAMIAEGKSNKEIAWACKLGEGTIKVYATHIYAKAGVKGRIPFVLWWLKRNERLVA